MLNAKENCYTVTCDVPGAFMQADIDELIHLMLDGELAELLIKVDASYHKFLTYEGETSVIYDYSTSQLDTKYLDELIAKVKAGDVINLLSAQMSAKKGLKVFGEAGANGITKELEQILYRKVMHGVLPSQLNRKQKRAALKYLMFLKEKHCGKIKGWGCADGCKQRV